MTRLEKEKVLERIYYDVEEGFGSVRDLYDKARKVDVGISLDPTMQVSATSSPWPEPATSCDNRKTICLQCSCGRFLKLLGCLLGFRQCLPVAGFSVKLVLPRQGAMAAWLLYRSGHHHEHGSLHQ